MRAEARRFFCLSFFVPSWGNVSCILIVMAHSFYHLNNSNKRTNKWECEIRKPTPKMMMICRLICTHHIYYRFWEIQECNAFLAILLTIVLLPVPCRRRTCHSRFRTKHFDHSMPFKTDDDVFLPFNCIVIPWHFTCSNANINVFFSSIGN